MNMTSWPRSCDHLLAKCSLGKHEAYNRSCWSSFCTANKTLLMYFSISCNFVFFPGNENLYVRGRVWKSTGIGKNRSHEIFWRWHSAAGKVCGNAAVMFHLCHLIMNQQSEIAQKLYQFSLRIKKKKSKLYVVDLLQWNLHFSEIFPILIGVYSKCMYGVYAKYFATLL